MTSTFVGSLYMFEKISLGAFLTMKRTIKNDNVFRARLETSKTEMMKINIVHLNVKNV